jgi:hypothetical protein
MGGKVATGVWSINDDPLPFRDASCRSIAKQSAFAINGWRAVISAGDSIHQLPGITPSTGDARDVAPAARGCLMAGVAG